MEPPKTGPAISEAGRRHLADGLERLKQKNHTAATECFRKLTQSDPKLPIGWVLVSDQELRAGRTAEARTAALHATGLDANDPDGWIALGGVHGHAEEFEQAETCYRKAIDTDRSSEELWDRVVASMIHNGLFAEAIALCAEEAERMPEHATALARLGGAYAASDCLEEAMDTWRKVLALTPGDGHTRLVMAQTLHMMDDDACLLHCRESILRDDIPAEVKQELEKLVKQILGGQPRR